jgi:hypothetical protein
MRWTGWHIRFVARSRSAQNTSLITARSGEMIALFQAGATSDDIGTSSVYAKPLGSYASLTWPFNCWPRDPIKRVPKLCRDGVRTCRRCGSILEPTRVCFPEGLLLAELATGASSRPGTIDQDRRPPKIFRGLSFGLWCSRPPEDGLFPFLERDFQASAILFLRR